MILNNFFTKKRVFLDYASTTPIDKEVLKEMTKGHEAFFANPSALYNEALLAKEAVAEARKKIADLLNAQKNDIIFTSGGTEGNSLALLGVFEASLDRKQTENFTPHFITTNIEHPAILEVFNEIKNRGGEVTIVPVSEDGSVSVKDIAGAIKENTVLVSVMYANNEIGTVQPIKEIGRAIKEWRQKRNTNLPYFHTDACQAPLYLDIDVLKLNVDLMTLDGIKIYGPRGFGVLYAKSNVKIKSIIFGGGQEKGLRSGTENTPGILGMAKALEIAGSLREKEEVRLKEIQDYAIEEILKSFPESTLNGSKENRLPNNINICFPGLDAEFAVVSLDVAGISSSYSSSCRTLAEDSSSYVVTALGKNECSSSSLRFTLGRESTKDDINFLISALKRVVLQ